MSDTAKQERVLLSAEEVSKWIGLSPSWIQRKAGTEFPLPRKIGGATRWFRHHIEEWLLEKERETE